MMVMENNDGDFIMAEKPGKCFVCGELCSTVELNFETYVCVGNCMKQLNDDYFDNCRRM